MNNDLVEKLMQARADSRELAAGPWNVAVPNIDEAYRIQSEITARTGNAVLGWKVSALTPEQQRGFLTDRPVAGALLSPFVHTAPAKLSIKQFVAPLLECEVAFVLGADLPARTKPYTREEIEAAIEAVVPAVEIADSRCPADAPNLLKLADFMGNGAFITATPIRDWRKLDLENQPVTLTLDGSVIKRGISSRIVSNPLLAVIALANAQPLPAGGLKRGQVITTGSGIIPIAPKPGAYIADLGALGTLRFDMVA
jgi:2-keto-4-pentenoate hydratase